MGEVGEVPGDGDTYRRLIRRLWVYRARLLLSVGLSVVIGALFASTLLVLKPAADLLFDPQGLQRLGQTLDDSPTLRWAGPAVVETLRPWLADRRQALMGVALLVLILGVVKNLCRFVQEYLAAWVGERLVIDLVEELYVHVQRLEPSFFDREGPQQVVSRFVNDATLVGGGLAKIFARVVREPLKAVGAFLIAASINLKLTLICLVLFPIAGVVMVQVGRRIKKRYKAILAQRQAILGQLAENFRGIRILQIFGLEQHFAGRFRDRNEGLFTEIRRAMRLDVATSPILEAMIHVLGAGVVLYTGLRVIGGQMPPGEFLLFYATIAALFDPVSKLSGLYNKLQSSVASAGRVFWLLDQKPAVSDPAQPVAIGRIQGAIRFEDVSYDYPVAERFAGHRRPTALQGVTLEIRPGEMIGIVGETGAGKSTLVNLLPRFADPSSGRITIDGHDLRELSLAELRSQIAIVTQDHLLWDASIADNIRLGCLTATDEELEAAARAAYIHDWIVSQPEGYRTPVGESGVGLSGGQKQRLALARAILHDPRVMILDEATSALDPDSEAKVQAALQAFSAERTTLVIAHRLSTLRNADRIVVLDGGRLESAGTHEELLERSAVYPRLVAGSSMLG